MQIQQTQLQQIKLALHAGQLVFGFIGAILALVVLTKDGKTGGSVGFYFALVSTRHTIERGVKQNIESL
jgi:hypothetical protein